MDGVAKDLLRARADVDIEESLRRALTQAAVSRLGKPWPGPSRDRTPAQQGGVNNPPPS
jgi:hypothetical protein